MGYVPDNDQKECLMERKGVYGERLQGWVSNNGAKKEFRQYLTRVYLFAESESCHKSKLWQLTVQTQVEKEMVERIFQAFVEGVGFSTRLKVGFGDSLLLEGSWTTYLTECVPTPIVEGMLIAQLWGLKTRIYFDQI